MAKFELVKNDNIYMCYVIDDEIKEASESVANILKDVYDQIDAIVISNMTAEILGAIITREFLKFKSIPVSSSVTIKISKNDVDNIIIANVKGNILFNII